jgi:pimeloyl-ACP methyl ester carboxylesterase
MAEDTIAYLDQVIGSPAHLLGWSDGAVVAVRVAMGRPELIDRLVLIGQYFNSTDRSDSVLLDQLVTCCRADVLTAGRLAVLPGSHTLPIESPEIVNPLVVAFLRGGPDELA